MHFQNINRTDSGCENKGTLKYMPKWKSMLHVLRAQQKAKGHGDSEQGFSTSSRLTGSVTVRSCNIRAHFCWGFSMAFASPSSNWEQYSKTLPNYTVQFKRHGIDIAWLSVLSLKTMAAFVRHLKTEVKSMLFLDFFVLYYATISAANSFEWIWFRGLGGLRPNVWKIMIQSKYHICIYLHLIFVFSCLFVQIFSSI